MREKSKRVATATKLQVKTSRTQESNHRIGDLSKCGGALFAVAMLTCQVAAALPPVSSHPASGAAELSRDPRMVLWRQTFFWAVILLFIFVVAAGAIIRFTQRFRSVILSGPASPTPSEDVWSMHKAPERLEFEDDEPSSS